MTEEENTPATEEAPVEGQSDFQKEAAGNEAAAVEDQAAEAPAEAPAESDAPEAPAAEGADEDDDE